VNYRRTLELLDDQPQRIAPIAKHLGMTIGSTYKLIDVLKAAKVVAVVDYEWTAAGRRVNLYGLGSKDKRIPKKMPAQRSKDWRTKQKFKHGLQLDPFSVAVANIARRSK
jgi:predicted ArsR family transcriptional regulator